VPKTNKEIITLKGWCSKNGYPGVTKQCVMSAFQSPDPQIQNLAKREKMKGMIENGER
jgi:hypothetical protein